MTRRPRIGVGSAFGSCGELLQGVTAEHDRHFLVTLPIRSGSVAIFEPLDEPVSVVPPHKSKALRLATAMVGRSAVLPGGRLTVLSDLPEGKGLASSTADLVATARAIADAERRTLHTREIEADLRAIEPSDGVMHAGSVAYFHRDVRLLARLGHLPALTIVAADEGGLIDTVEFNRHTKPLSRQVKHEYSALLTELGAAIESGDVRRIGTVATRSAQLNGSARHRPHLDTTITAAHDLGALGVVVAHSGTTTGILLDDTEPDYLVKLAAAQELCATFAESHTVHHTWQPCPPDGPDPFPNPAGHSPTTTDSPSARQLGECSRGRTAPGSSSSALSHRGSSADAVRDSARPRLGYPWGAGTQTTHVTLTDVRPSDAVQAATSARIDARSGGHLDQATADRIDEQTRENALSTPRKARVR
ncbi:GHMP family kinase ATP-binding protein [Nocardia mangyaensis]|uniref:GHMP family kinase ATP-binding protein n=1 Tax=Nocardia mangyaensis TaxID=2213200 RepID=UPI0026748992|nr:hypothetical protein [Nocardia mangyaensis]MDO3649919.1 hypothetical protein [Nocardia mangyaensis]